MSDAIIKKLIIVTQTPPSHPVKQSQQNKKAAVSSTPTTSNIRRLENRLNEEMEHGLRSYEEELWSVEGNNVSFKVFGKL